MDKMGSFFKLERNGHSSILAAEPILCLNNQGTYVIGQTHPLVNRFDHASSKPSTLYVELDAMNSWQTISTNCAGRLKKRYQTDGGGDSAWSDADDISGDIVLNQQEFTYDAASNLILAVNRDRFHDNASTATGELGTPTTGNKARVSYQAFYYDAANRPTDSVNVGTNGGSAYTRPGSVPSRSNTVLVNSYSYNDAGHLETVTDPRGVVPKVQYAYSEMSGGANASRLTQLVYPQGATVNYSYSSGVDSAISRNTSAEMLSTGNTTLSSEAYSYLGLGHVVVKSRPVATLSYIQATSDTSANTDAGYKYTDMDRFGRVIDQVWRSVAGSGTNMNRYQYGNDRAGIRLFKNNLLVTALSELYAYDNLNQLTSFSRGVLSDANSDFVFDTVSSPSRTQAWSIDSPEMFEFADQLDDGLRRLDIDFHDSSPELLMEISKELVSENSMNGGCPGRHRDESHLGQTLARPRRPSFCDVSLSVFEALECQGVKELDSVDGAHPTCRFSSSTYTG